MRLPLSGINRGCVAPRIRVSDAGLVKFCPAVTAKMKTQTIAAALALRAGDPVETAFASGADRSDFRQAWAARRRSAGGSWLNPAAAPARAARRRRSKRRGSYRRHAACEARRRTSPPGEGRPQPPASGNSDSSSPKAPATGRPLSGPPGGLAGPFPPSGSTHPRRAAARPISPRRSCAEAKLSPALAEPTAAERSA
jgi:hypothetical protein